MPKFNFYIKEKRRPKVDFLVALSFSGVGFVLLFSPESTVGVDPKKDRRRRLVTVGFFVLMLLSSMGLTTYIARTPSAVLVRVHLFSLVEVGNSIEELERRTPKKELLRDLLFRLGLVGSALSQSIALLHCCT